MRYQKTEWGLTVTLFVDRYGLTKKQIAKACGVSYNTMLQVLIGKTPGEQIIPKVEEFMRQYAAKADPKGNMALRPFEHVQSLTV